MTGLSGRGFLVLVATLFALAACGDSAVDDPMTVGDLVGNPSEDEVVLEGTTGLLGAMFCPCFELTSGGSTIAVWFDLGTHDGVPIPAVDVAAISNGDTVQVTGWLLEEPPLGTPRELVATEIIKVADGSDAGLANPASVYCEEQGGTVDIRTGDDGAQQGFCVFPDGSECEEWAYFREQCRPASGG